MNSQEIEITIRPDGRVEYTIKGVKGAACQDISALLEQLGKVEHDERTGEFYEDDSHVDVTVAGA
ncbi:MAG: DUF2997 domain-containing protein [Caldilinea sp.]|nr:DUF2997 domain-containing protein [Caldilinea sp.]MCB0137750.1 DUF2997 domain-containing protein [Caldilineaceae bacterium]MCB0039803.1 DUF2997 domain-containing protein [Caldilinea sp.]MCB0050335.1 DUF2997 domain-containing protein [Caldilinea sp.]MCB0148487.1 DUF2997 domain-containing protein [Caldilineaceae bacterium]